ncbi:MAG TPA: phosphatase PAP2 family protein [Rhizomicrobium sp.]
MTARLQLILLAIVAVAAATDVAWARIGHFDIDAPAYGLLALLTAGLAAGGLFYDRVRRDERLAAMLFGTSFLIGMSAAFSVLNYLLLTVAGPRIDVPLAAIDRALGIDWPALMAFVAHYPWANMVLQLVYISVLPQIALLTVALGFKGKPEQIYALCLSVAAGAAIAIGVWTAAPSFGAFSVYELPASVSSHLALALDGHYARELVALLAHGPGRISPSAAQGLIGFPSYHAVLALLVVWYARELSVIRWLALALNAIVLVATPIQGGHHVVDVLAGFAVAALAVWLANSALRFAARATGQAALKTQTARL